MSWILGCSGHITDEVKKKLSGISQQHLHRIETNNLLILAGGNPDTCFSSNESKWIATGFIIDEINNKKVWLRKEGLLERIHSENYEALDGHFIILKWTENQLKFYSDSIGLRTIYFMKTGDTIYFSTKLKWLTTLSSSVELDLNEFGSRWLTYNQWSHNSFIKNILRLPPGATAIIINNQINISKQNWMPEIGIKSKDKLIQLTENFLNLQIPSDYNISLGLSGGLDSRFLLALLHDQKKDFAVHTFGDENDPDVITAKKIGLSLGIKVNWIAPLTHKAESLIDELKVYASETELVEPITTYLKLKLFKDDYFQSKILVDGAMAEFARNQFLKKLRILGRFALKTKNYRKIFEFIKTNRCSIFKDTYQFEMIKSVSTQLRDMFAEINISPDSVNSFTNVMIAKYRLPNYFGPEQSRLDTILQGFMPFAQKEIISTCLSIPDSVKKNNRLMYSVINELCPALTKIELIKNGTRYPFGSSTLKATIISKLSSRRRDSEEIKNMFFAELESFIKDHFNSSQVRSFELYDYSKISSLIDDYYKGNKSRVDEVNWLLSFEFFRLGLNIR